MRWDSFIFSTLRSPSPLLLRAHPRALAAGFAPYPNGSRRAAPLAPARAPPQARQPASGASHAREGPVAKATLGNPNPPDADADATRAPKPPAKPHQEACALAGDGVDAPRRQDLPSLWQCLPQIVVVGGQSSGKSSVLEAIVGRDFLPRGAGICTRRPLILQLHCVDDAEKDTARFLHKPDEVFDDFREVRAEIEAETDRLLGPNTKSVSAEPIVLSVRSANVPNLTLVDVPGLTKVPTANQPASVVRDIEAMVKKFVTPPDVIVVAVSPANADIATSDGIRVAREVDPGLVRTVGVLTKLDLMDRGTDASEVLAGRAVRLKLGWCAVVNRSQFDINADVDMSAARANERAFFDANRDKYSIVNCGTGVLTEMLTGILGDSIRRRVPRVRETIDGAAAALEQELRCLGTSVPSDRGALMHEVLISCGEFEKEFVKSLEGGRGGGETIRVIFEDKLVNSLRSLNLREFYGAEFVKSVVDATDGYQPHLVAPELGIRRLIELGLARLRDPAAQCVRAVDRVLRSMVERSVEDGAGGRSGAASSSASSGGRGSSSSLEASSGGQIGGQSGGQSGVRDRLRRFPSLRAAVASAAYGALDARRDESERMVAALVDMEASYFDADFFRRFTREEHLRRYNNTASEPDESTPPTLDEAPDGRPTTRSSELPAWTTTGDGDDDANGIRTRDGADPFPRTTGWDDRVGLIRASVYAYVDAVRTRIAKSVPKAAVHCQVVPARSGLLADFYANLGGKTREELASLMAEDDGVGERREACKTRLGLLNRARAEIVAVVG